MLVQKLRLQRGWSQQQLAELTGLSVRTIQRIEQGQPGSMESLNALAAVFDIDLATLKGNTDMQDHQTAPSRREEELAFQHVRRVRSFYSHALAYAVVQLVLLAINLIVTPKHLWFVFPALSWGAALAVQGLTTFDKLPFLGAAWEKREVERRLGRSL